MIIYETLEDLQTNVPEIASQLDCLGISIDKKLYSINFLEKSNTSSYGIPA